MDVGKFWKFQSGGGVKIWGLISENPEGRGVVWQLLFLGWYEYLLEPHICTFHIDKHS